MFDRKRSMAFFIYADNEIFTKRCYICEIPDWKLILKTIEKFEKEFNFLNELSLSKDGF